MIQNKKTIRSNILQLLKSVNSEIDEDTDLKPLKNKCLLDLDYISKLNNEQTLNLKILVMTRFVYDNYWDSKDVYFKLLALDDLQKRYNQDIKTELFNKDELDNFVDLFK